MPFGGKVNFGYKFSKIKKKKEPYKSEMRWQVDVLLSGSFDRRKYLFSFNCAGSI